MMKFTAIVEKGETAFVAHCPELDICSQGSNLEKSLQNLQEAVELYLEEVQDKESVINGIFNKRLFITSFFANA